MIQTTRAERASAEVERITDELRDMAAASGATELPERALVDAQLRQLQEHVQTMQLRLEAETRSKGQLRNMLETQQQES